MRAVLLLALAALLFAQPAPAATIVIVNNDGPGEGFNDPTPATPVGGNAGVTIGEQRLNVFQYAADIWGTLLPSAVTIRVRSNFDALTCDASGGVLGSAGPIEVYRDFTGAEWPLTWYHVALANRLAGSDLGPAEDDIVARFNSSLDNNDACLAGTNWYYGLDGNEGGDIELLPVILHELGHGLGFSEFVDTSTGELFLGRIDIYSRHLYDETQGKLWSQMTNGERVDSAINTNQVVWSGFAANFAAPSYLEGPPVVEITAPPAIAQVITTVGTASFGPPLTTSPISGEVVLVDDGTGTGSDACEPLVNGAEIAGKIALIDRGTCTFVSKVQAAEAAGAVAAIIINNVSPGVINLGGTDPAQTIPSVMIELDAGNAIKTQLGLAETVNATLVLDDTSLAGTSAGTGQLLVYTPNPLEPGSSVSHWDISASPNLLMEPAINTNLSNGVDLTKYQFEDIGWFDPRVTDSPNLPATRTALKGNVPNPFNPSTTIQFELSRAEEVQLEIFDPAGRLVKRLLQERRSAGSHTVKWNGRDDAGEPVASGVYFYRFRAGDYEATERMVLLK